MSLPGTTNLKLGMNFTHTHIHATNVNKNINLQPHSKNLAKQYQNVHMTYSTRISTAKAFLIRIGVNQTTKTTIFGNVYEPTTLEIMTMSSQDSVVNN